jgi:hypothetical protein
LSKRDIIKAYFQGLEKASYQDIVKLFAPNAIVYSHLYGKIEATRFYKELFSEAKLS